MKQRREREKEIKMLYVSFHIIWKERRRKKTCFDLDSIFVLNKEAKFYVKNKTAYRQLKYLLFLCYFSSALRAKRNEKNWWSTM